ncbi:MAG: archaetidylserine decarboxylase [Gammaproteobacteria bacterium]|nr:phosphatidylserine decarboxylase [Gammaproteobacteria bacterium]
MPSPFVWLQHVLPQALVSRAVYKIARSEARWIKNPLSRWFARHYGVDLAEAAEPDPTAYPTFNAFFTRPLKPGARKIAPGETTIVSPVDGRLTEFGYARSGTLLQAKGFAYALEELIGEGPVDSRAFENGAYATIYLAPYDYHRVHMPLAGTLTATRYVPGRRFSVNAATTCGIRRLFCRNERVVCWFDTAYGPMVLVLVGALNVSSISTVSRGEIESGAPRYWPESLVLAKGAEIGRFNLGSTVVLLFPEGRVEWAAELRSGEKLELGRAIGRIREVP